MFCCFKKKTKNIEDLSRYESFEKNMNKNVFKDNTLSTNNMPNNCVHNVLINKQLKNKIK